LYTCNSILKMYCKDQRMLLKFNKQIFFPLIDIYVKTLTSVPSPRREWNGGVAKNNTIKNSKMRLKNGKIWSKKLQKRDECASLWYKKLSCAEQTHHMLVQDCCYPYWWYLINFFNPELKICWHGWRLSPKLRS